MAPAVPEIIDLTLDDDDDDENTNPPLDPSRIVFNPHAPSIVAQPAIKHLPPAVGPSTTKLSREDHRTLVKKRTWLRAHTVAPPSALVGAVSRTQSSSSSSSARSSRSRARNRNSTKATNTDTASGDNIADSAKISDTAARGGIAGNAAANPVGATLVFAQQEAGTAVCLSRRGLVLTCAHCIADAPADLSFPRRHWLLFPSGALVAAVALAWDPRRDLALLQITHHSPSVLSPGNSSGTSSASTTSPTSVTSSTSAPGGLSDHPSSSSALPRISFPHVRVAASAPRPGTPLACIGHPAAEDLEHPIPGTQTGYDVLVVSEGTFRGLAAAAPDRRPDPQDNAEIGALMHDCWTYWGHSGAPLLQLRGGRGNGQRETAGSAAELIGLHSSWDDETGMRRGVPWEAVTAFLDECGRRFGSQTPDDWPWSTTRSDRPA
ncbi:AT hook domain-containing protein [Purpureocillium lavendulum]|uniref:AT hook domain-containing protein n=1 Tax=Purpureocillium lavendulum TaxID=1247861 RepID=A0AB34FL82_9HYPO|nr:AT hook domain-containing protein [Purpureocillium lavendulum]